ncbi:MAG: response regulator [Deltaproteobacteria bacterium]|jgi:two-component system chemotaxis response regulator CheY
MTHKILVVDDSATIRQQAGMFLRSKGFEVVEAQDGQQGYEKAQSEDVALMLVDVNMPVMNGIEMIGKVRQLDKHAKTPIFMVTTESSKAKVQEGKAAGATAWMVKPFNPDLLMKAITKVLGL